VQRKGLSGLDYVVTAAVLSIMVGWPIFDWTSGGGRALGQAPDNTAALVQRLKALKPLPKRHYSDRADASVYESPELLGQYVRITGACTVHLVWTPDEWIDACLEAAQANDGQLAVYYSPLQERISKAKKEGANLFEVTLEVGAPFVGELSAVETRLRLIKLRADRAGVGLGAVVFDHEALIPDEVTRSVVVYKLNLFAEIVRRLTPAARLIWYGRGGVRECAGANCADGNEWETLPWTPMAVDGDAVSAPLYWTIETHHWRGIMRETVARHGETPVVPWVTLGRTFVREGDRRRMITGGFEVGSSWKLGAELMQAWRGRQAFRFLPNATIESVVIWPGPGRDGVAFWDHFEAYVRGATD
jgi:hypothetical protein